MDRYVFEWISLQFDDWVVSAGFKTIRVDLHRFWWIWFVFIDLGRFYMISTIWQIGVGSDRFRNIWWTWLGESEWIYLIFCGFELFGWIWADFNRFGWICVDLGWLERIAADLEVRYKFIFVGFGRVRWIRVEMAKSLMGLGLRRFGWRWAALMGFGRIWLDLAGSRCRFVWISKLDFVGYRGI